MRHVLWHRKAPTLCEACSALLAMLSAAPAQAELANADAIHTVVVTGSRIRSEAGESTGPVTVLSKEQLMRGGNDSLGKVLQTLPYNTGAPTNTNVNNGGDGSTRIDLRGLKPQRTVILLNGRRLPNGGIGADFSVDIDSLPLSMVERVEVLTTGASAVYGADAIGGVVNVITRSDFKGVEVGAQRSESDRGDGTISRTQALVGDDIGQGNWMLGADYVDQKGVSMAEREYSSVPIAVASVDGTRVVSGSPNIADGRFMVRNGNALGLPAGSYTRVGGATGQAASDWRPVSLSETFNYAPYTYLQTPNERWSLWLMGSRPLPGGVELFVEGLFRRRESSQNLAPAPYMIGTGAAPTLTNGSAGIPANNYYNPFGVDVSRGGRRIIELTDRGFSQRVDVWRALAGVRGQVRSWKWEVSAAISDSDAVTRELGLPLASRFVTGLGSSGPDASGRIVCGTPDQNTGIVPAGAVISGCVPINLFGGAGSITQEQLDYLGGPLQDEGYNSQRLANVGLEGPWGRTPAGEILWALGSEFRRESGAYRYDPQRVGGTVSTGLAGDIPGGSFEAREGYAEVRLPLIDEQSGWGNLGTTLGGRISDFNTFGTHTTWHAGLHWELSKSWAVRADYATLFRAPALNELYEAQVAGDEFQALDPCGDSPTPQQQVNCAANDVPGGSYVQSSGDLYLLYVGGNTDLEPEDGYSFDAGIQFRWSGASTWQASIDFFQTRLDGFVEKPDDTTILYECATYGTPLACARIRRFSDGSIRSVDTRVSNYGRVTVEGIDLSVSLDLPTRAGDFNLHALTTNLLKHDAQVFEGSETFHNAGRATLGFIVPEWRALGGVRWARDMWSASYTLQWIGPYTDCTITLDEDTYCGDVSSVFYHDVDASYQWAGIVVRAGVNNLTDKDPPYLNQESNTSPATYRLLGRTYFLQLTYALR